MHHAWVYACNELVMRPDDEAEDTGGEHGVQRQLVAEEFLAGERWYDLTDDPQGGK